MFRVRDREDYNKTFHKRIERWLNKCVFCQTIGYKPDMPKQIGEGGLAQNIRAFYTELRLNEFGLCEMCAEHSEKFPSVLPTVSTVEMQDDTNNTNSTTRNANWRK